VIGNLSYNRQLTGKTSLVLVSREPSVATRLRAVPSSIHRGVGCDLAGDYKVALTINYSYTRSTFSGQVIPGSTATAESITRQRTLPMLRTKS